MPACFIGMCGPQQCRLGERLARQLHRNGKTALAETRANADGWKACDIERHGEGRLLHIGPFLHAVDARRLARLGRADDDVEIFHRRRHFPAQQAAAARGLDHVRAADRRGEADTVTKQFSVVHEMLAHPRAVQRERLGNHDQIADRVVIRCRGQRDVADLGAFLGVEIHGRVDPRARGVRRAMVLFEEMPDHADAQSLHTPAKLGREIRDRPIDAGRVFGIGTSHALQQQPAIFRRPGHRAGVIERESQGQNAGPAGQAVSRLDSGNAAESRRSADRSTGVGPGSAQDETGGDGRPGARG
jgi:hypothetical protein